MDLWRKIYRNPIRGSGNHTDAITQLILHTLLNEFGNKISLGNIHRMNSPITSHVSDALFSHAKELREEGASHYTAIDLGSGPSAELAGILVEKAKERSDLPQLKMEALDIVKGKAPPGVKYIEGNIMNIPGGKESRHAVIASNSLDYVEKKPAAMEKIARILIPNGLLVMVAHAEDSHTVQRWQEEAEAQNEAWNALRNARGPLDADTRELLIKNKFYQQMGSDSPEELWREAINPGPIRAVIHAIIDSGKPELEAQIAAHLKQHHFTGIDQIRDMLAAHGFMEPRIRPFQQNQDRFYVVVTRKKGAGSTS